MRIRAWMMTVVGLLAMTGTVEAQPGTAYLQARGGAMVPLGDFADEQDVGGGYTIGAGYEVCPFFDLLLEFTHSFNDADDVRFREPGLNIVSDETKQTFVVSTGGRVNFLPSDFRVRPYAHGQVGWYHFANFNSVEIEGRSLLGDEDEDAVGLQAGLGIEGTVLQVYEQRGDAVPMLEMTVGAHASYHHAILTDRDDRQFLTAMASVGLRF